MGVSQNEDEVTDELVGDLCEDDCACPNMHGPGHACSRVHDRKESEIEIERSDNEERSDRL